jgi:hypothetical protein
MNDPEFRGKPPEERTAPAAPAAPITAPAPASGGFPSSNWNNTDPKPAAPAAPAAPAKESGKFWLSPEEWEAYKGYAGVRPGSTKVDADINYIIIAFKLMPDEIKSVHRQAIDGLILNRTVPTLTRLKSLVAYAKRNNLNQYVPDDIKSNY